MKKIFEIILWIIRAIFGGTAKATAKAEQAKIVNAGEQQKKTITKVTSTEENGKIYTTTVYENGKERTEVANDKNDVEINNASDFNAGR